MGSRSRLAAKAHSHSGRVLNVKFVIVVPSGVHAVLQQFFRHLIVPKSKGLRVRKVQVTAQTVPKLGNIGAAVCILDKETLGRQVIVHWVAG